MKHAKSKKRKTRKCRFQTKLLKENGNRKIKAEITKKKNLFNESAIFQLEFFIQLLSLQFVSIPTNKLADRE